MENNFDFLPSELSLDARKNQYNQIKSKTIDAIIIGIIIQNILEAVQDNFIRYDGNNIIASFVIISIKILMFICYKILRMKLKRYAKMMDSIFLIINFILQCINYFVVDIYQNNQNESDLQSRLDTFMHLINLMTWLLLIYTVLTFFGKIVAFVAFYLYLINFCFANTTFILQLSQIFVLSITFICGAYLTAKRQNYILDDLEKYLKEEKTYRKILENLPQSLVILDFEKMDLQYSNFSFQKLVNSKKPNVADFNALTSNIKNIKLESGSTSWLNHYKINIEEGIKIDISDKKVELNLGKNKNQVVNSEINTKESCEPMILQAMNENVFSERVILSKNFEDSNINKSLIKSPTNKENLPILHSKLKNFDNYFNEIRCEKNDSSNMIINDKSSIICNNDIIKNIFTLEELLQAVVNTIDSPKQSYHNTCILRGDFENKELEIKIIESVYNNKPSLLLLLTDMTHHNLKIKLEDNQQYKSLMLKSLSHELKTPLNGSIAMIESSIDDFNTSESTKTQLLLPALNSLKLLNLFINDVLDYSQILGNSLSLQFKAIDLKQITKEIIQLMHYHINEKRNIEYRSS